MEQRTCAVEFNGYEGDLAKLVQRRLGERLQAEAEDSRVYVRIGNEGDFETWCQAVAAVLSRDLSCLELADMVSGLGATAEEKRAILTEAIRKMRREAEPDIEGDIREYFESHELLDLEGYMRFRMKEAKARWELCVLRAAEERLLAAEYQELLTLLSAVVRLRPPRIREIYVILNPDGSCTLTDDMDSRVRFDDAGSEGVMSALVGLSPARITVYDLSGGQCAGFAQTLSMVFADRVRYFK